MEIDGLSEHDIMLLSLVEKLKEEKYENIKAHLPDHEMPDGIPWQPNIKKYFPDAAAEKNSKFFIFEIETSDSISEEHSHHQWRAFSDFAKILNSTFALVVPKRNESMVRNILTEKNIFAEVWTQD